MIRTEVFLTLAIAKSYVGWLQQQKTLQCAQKNFIEGPGTIAIPCPKCFWLCRRCLECVFPSFNSSSNRCAIGTTFTDLRDLPPLLSSLWSLWSLSRASDSSFRKCPDPLLVSPSSLSCKQLHQKVELYPHSRFYYSRRSFVPPNKSCSLARNHYTLRCIH